MPAEGITEEFFGLTTQLTQKINKAACEAINSTQYAEAYYWTLMGTPSATEPWGFQADGHHLVINYFVLGDQVVMSPCFWGCEPTSMEIGGTRTEVMREEIEAALAVVNSLGSAQRSTAILKSEKDHDEITAGAFTDNAVVEYKGMPDGELTPAQRRLLLALINRFVGKAKDDVAKVRMTEIRKHLNETHRLDRRHHRRLGLLLPYPEPGHLDRTRLPVTVRLRLAVRRDQRGDPTQQHLHCVVRTPNGNGYGKELLRQHLLTAPHHH